MHPKILWGKLANSVWSQSIKSSSHLATYKLGIEAVAIYFHNKYKSVNITSTRTIKIKNSFRYLQDGRTEQDENNRSDCNMLSLDGNF